MGIETVERVHDGILNSKLGLIGELEWVQEWLDPVPKLLQDKSINAHLLVKAVHDKIFFEKIFFKKSKKCSFSWW